MSQYKVPQNVEAEDKILGPLTLKQFIYVVIGIGWAFLCFFLLKSVPPVMILVAAPVTLLFLLLGFYQRDGQNFEQLLVAMVGYFSQSRRRVWTKEPVVETFVIEPKKPVVEQSQRTPTEVRSELEKLAGIVDARGWAEPHDAQGVLDTAAVQPAPSAERIVMPREVPVPAGTEDPGKQPDILDVSHSPLSMNLEAMIDQAAQEVRQEALDMMSPPKASAARAAIAGGPQPVPDVPAIGAPPIDPDHPMEPADLTPSISVTTPVPDAILELATERDDLTVSQLAAQAMRNAPLQEGESVRL